MQRMALSEWQNSLLVIYDPNVTDETGYLLDKWLAHWPAELRPKGGLTLTSLPFLEWLAQRLMLAQDLHLHFCFVAIEPLNPALVSSSPGESATALWLKRSESNGLKNQEDGIIMSAPNIINKEFGAELFDNFMGNLSAYDALIWDGDNNKFFKKILKLLHLKGASNILENNTIWAVKRMAGCLQHYDALQVALASQVAIDSSSKVILLNTRDNMQSRVATLSKIPLREV